MDLHPARFYRRSAGLLALLTGSDCANAQPETASSSQHSASTVLSGLIVMGPEGVSSQPMDIALEDGLITGVVPTGSTDWGDVERVELAGHWATPAFIDSHVHLTYLAVSSEMADGGIAAAVDLAAPQTADDPAASDDKT